MGNEAEELEIEGTEKPIVEGEGVVEPELDAEGNPVKPEVEAWMQVDDPEKAAEPGQEVVTDPPKKPTQKQKLRARLDGANDENEQLKQRIAELEKGQTAEVAGSLKRPDRDDFDTDTEYNVAYDDYRDKKDDARDSAKGQQARTQQHVQAQSAKVDAHYVRGEKLVTEHAISPEVYQASDLALRTAAETERPGYGEAIVNDMISRLGEGSEKTLFFIGRNKPLLNEFRTLLKDDPSGLDALVFVVKQGEKANGTKKSTSQAPAPVAQINGEGSVGSASKQKKAYDKETDPQKRYNMKKAAKAGKLDVSDWK